MCRFRGRRKGHTQPFAPRQPGDAGPPIPRAVMSRQSWRAGSACFIARLSSSVENVDRRKDEQPLGQDALDGDARPRRGASRRRRLASRQRHHRLERPDNREMR